MKTTSIKLVCSLFLIPHMKTEINILKIFSLMVLDMQLKVAIKIIISTGNNMSRKDYIFLKKK